MTQESLNKDVCLLKLECLKLAYDHKELGYAAEKAVKEAKILSDFLLCLNERAVQDSVPAK